MKFKSAEEAIEAMREARESEFKRLECLILSILKEKGRVSANDLWASEWKPDNGQSRNIIGGAFMRLQRAGLLEASEFERAMNPDSRGRRILVYRNPK